ncbi:hypothetical protein Fcan01_15859 [Folsomia candida]|uniref:Uncharacterized protein n=2 Tax=Folsomia candida TaxID=158441 RepID=A0A226DZC1_FOLCA|nr:hypothetical protein Fcan01_15859 [Folsomia candida]
MQELQLFSDHDYLTYPAKVKKALKLVKTLQGLGKSDPAYNVCLLHKSIRILTVCLYENGNYGKCADLLEKCISVAETVGEGVPGFTLRINLIRCWMEMKNILELKKQLDILKKHALCWFGSLDAISILDEDMVVDLEELGIKVFD